MSALKKSQASLLPTSFFILIPHYSINTKYKPASFSTMAGKNIRKKHLTNIKKKKKQRKNIYLQELFQRETPLIPLARKTKENNYISQLTHSLSKTTLSSPCPERAPVAFVPLKSEAVS